MVESIKALCALALIAAAVSGAIAWNAADPDAVTWGFRLGGPTLSLLLLAGLLKSHFRADLERDYLKDVTGSYFNRDGFCFSFLVTAIDGVAVMEAYFQNQFDQRAMGRIALRPARGFFMTRAKIEAITYEVECPPAGYGVARLSIPLSKSLQGKRQSFEVGASVRYPDGKGRRLRFRDGIYLRANSDFGDSFGTALMIAGAAGGSLVLASPATARVALPVNVAEVLPGNIKPEVKILWQLGMADLVERA